MKMIQKAIPLLLLWAVCGGTAQAITVTVAGAIDYTLPDNITNAGDYYADVQTLTGTHNLSVTGVTTPNTTGWKLYAKLESSVSGLTVNVKRDGNGSGGVSLSGGESYTPLSTSEVLLCTATGTSDISSIPFSYQVQGLRNNLSQVSKGTKTWRINYRVVEDITP